MIFEKWEWYRKVSSRCNLEGMSHQRWINRFSPCLNCQRVNSSNKSGCTSQPSILLIKYKFKEWESRYARKVPLLTNSVDVTAKMEKRYSQTGDVRGISQSMSRLLKASTKLKEIHLTQVPTWWNKGILKIQWLSKSAYRILVSSLWTFNNHVASITYHRNRQGLAARPQSRIRRSNKVSSCSMHQEEIKVGIRPSPQAMTSIRIRRLQ